MAGEKKRFMVRVVASFDDTFRLRLPNGQHTRVKKVDVPTTVTDAAGTRTLAPMKVGDEIPAYIGDNGNLFVQFAERRSA